MSSENSPNIVIITLHDTGRHFGCYGVPGVSTPHIDALAGDGVRFDNCFTTTPVCSPSRGAMMTGRYPQSNGLMGLVHQPWWWELNDDERHLSHILADAGYATHLFGIQHETEDVSRLGYQHVHPETAVGRHMSAGQCAAQFVESLDAMADAEQPFYAAIGFFETHTPYGFAGAPAGDPDAQVVPPFIEDDAAARKHLAALAGSANTADDGVGTIVDALKVRNLDRNTLIVFTVDHGVELGRRAKWSVYDAGIEIALIMRWPDGDLNGGRVVSSLVSNVDVLPTILELIDIEPPDRVQGISFKPLLKGDHSHERREVFAMFDGQRDPRAIRTERYKLIRNFAPGRTWRLPHHISGGPTKWEPVAFVELYDLQADSHEMNNLANDPTHRQIRDELDARLLAWMKQVDDPILRGPVASPYYLQAIADIQPAR